MFPDVINPAPTDPLEQEIADDVAAIENVLKSYFGNLGPIAALAFQILDHHVGELVHALAAWLRSHGIGPTS